MNKDSVCPRKRRHINTNPMRHYDLELAVMLHISYKTGYVWSVSEIAEVCGVTIPAIRYVLNTGLRRAWRLLHQNPQLIKELNESRGLDGSNRVFLP
jgi:hypothetical protein